MLTACDDIQLRLPESAREQFIDRLGELLELDREQRHQARRIRAAAALYIGEKQ